MNPVMWIAIILALLLLAIGIAVIFFFVNFLQGLASGSTDIPGILSGQAKPSENVTYQFGQVLPTWTGTDRVTVLVLGIDERSQETGPWRTDTIMLATLDPNNLQAGMLSIPRDLWVPIPGYDQGRINTAHFLGDLYDYPGGGPALAKETVEYNLGVPVNYYVRVNFDGFVKLVDLIGGVDIYVEKVIDDPTYPGKNYDYDPLHIEPGQHHFDGEMALKYARTRHGDTDFGRARRQQQVLLAILARVSDLKLLPQLAPKSAEIYQTLQDSIKTDLAVDQILALATLAQKVDRSTIRTAVIDNSCTSPWTTPQGGQVLIPLRDKMREMRDYVFAADLPQSAGNPQITPTPETATIVVLNGTSRAGLAGTTAQYLQSQGLAIAQYNNADRQDYATTIILINREKPATTARLLTLLGLPQSAATLTANPSAENDITIILGADYAGPPVSTQTP